MDWHPVSDLPVQIGVAPGTLGLAIATASDEKFTSIAETRQRKTRLRSYSRSRLGAPKMAKSSPKGAGSIDVRGERRLIVLDVGTSGYRPVIAEESTT